MLRSPLLALALALAAAPAMAATQGDLDATSTGTAEIDLDVPEAVQITDMADITLTPAAADLTADVGDSVDVCVYSNVGEDRVYTVTASGDGTASAFTVSDGATTTIAYTVEFNDSVGGGGTALTTTVESAEFESDATAYDCGGGLNASFEVTFTPAVLQAAYAGSYNGTLTLLVSPGTP